MMTLTFGILLFLIDPNIKSPLDGIWSAWATMTQVGFGDVVPTSLFGRLLASGLILFGLVLFSLLTALVSVTLIGSNVDAVGMNEQRLDQWSGSATQDETKILAELARLHARMEAMEKQLLLHTVEDRSNN